MKKIVILALALVLCVGMLMGCNDGGNKDTAGGTTAAGTRTPGTGETLVLPEVEDGAVTSFDIDAFYEEQYAKMTPEEIAQFEQDLIDLGITKEEFASLLFYNGEGQTAAPVTSAPEDTTAAE